MSRPDLAFLQFARIVENAGGCAEDRPWGVEDDAGEIVACHATEADAQAAVDEMAPADDATPTEVRVFAVLAVEGFETADGRLLERGGWQATRTLPVPVWVQTDQPEWGGHAGAFIGGRWETMERMADGRRIYATGAMSIADERGTWAVEQVRAQNLRFVSIDVGEHDVEYEVREVDEDGWPTDVLTRFTEYEIAGATICGQPAIPLAVVWVDGMEPPAEFTAALPDEPERVAAPEVVESDGPGLLIMASASAPPEEWFAYSEELHGELIAQVEATGRAPHLRIIDEHRFVGFVAPFGVCHIAMPGCVTAPRSRTDYAYFATQEALARCCADCGEVHADAHEARRIPAGVLTMDTVHAARGLGAQDARYHYDHSGYAAARVAIGECDFGIWVAGAVLPGTPPDRLARLNGANLSGDWRLQRGALELCAVLAVNVPGFPMTRPTAHFVASGGELVQTALVGPLWPNIEATIAASGRGVEDPRWAHVHREMRDMHAEIKRLSSIAEPLRGQAAESLVASMRAN